jgi:hypothetical protein
LSCTSTGLPDKINKLFAVASTDIDVAKLTLQSLEDTLNNALDIQEQIKSCKSSQNYIPKEEIERTITKSMEKIAEATRILKRIEELKNEPGYLTDKEIEELSSSYNFLKCQPSLS